MLAPGLHAGVPMGEYLAIDAMSSGRFEWLRVSARHYQHMLSQPAADSAALSLGTALHAAVLEPAIFARDFVLEPIALVPQTSKTRATKAYKDAVADIKQGGFTVIRKDTMETVKAMAASVYAHPWAAKLIARCPERELTMLWNRGNRLCRGRADLLGPGCMGDLKTTRSLKDFNPWEITKYGYHRKAAWYRQGLNELGPEIPKVFFIAIESSAPFDVGVFEMDGPSLALADHDIERLLTRLDDCERTGSWPGMFPDIQVATVSDAELARMDDEAA